MKRTFKTTIATLTLLTASVVLSGCSKEEINLNDYVNPNFSGYDTIGYANPSIDSEALIDDYPDVFEDEDEDDVIEDILNYFEGTMEKTTQLSNGDTIDFEWTKSKIERMEEKYSAKFTCEDFEITVEGLEKGEDFNPFDYLEVTFEGISDSGSINIIKKDCPVDFSYTQDKYNKLKNNDTVKITISHTDSLSKNCQEEGYILTETEKEYTVTGLSHFINNIDELPEEFQNELKKQTEDAITAQTSEWMDGNEVKSMEFIGYHLLTSKNDSYYFQTQLYCIYKVNASLTGCLPEDNITSLVEDTYYNYYYLGNIVIEADGSCKTDVTSGYVNTNTCESKYGHLNWGYFSPLYFNGYSSLDDIYKDCITPQLEKYNHESTVK